MRFLAFIGLAAVITTLASCGTMSKEECRVADWGVVGDTDGAAGYNPQSRFADHVKSCSKSGATPNQTQWYQGYQTGIKRFCTPLSGASHGESGGAYNNVCPPEMEPGFVRGYSLGKRVYDLRSRIDSLRSDVLSRESEANRLSEELKKAEDKDRRSLRDRIDDAERDRSRARREADDLGYDLSEAERDLGYFRQTSGMPMAPARY